MKRHLPLLALTVATLIAHAPTSAHAQPVVGAQTYTTGTAALTDPNLVEVNAGLAQSFVVTVGGELTTIEIDAIWQGLSASGLYYYRLYQGAGTVPSGTVLRSGTLPSTAIGTGQGSLPIVLATPLLVNAGDAFTLALSRASDVGKLMWAVGDAPENYDSYASGQGFENFNGWSANLGGESFDYDFRLRALVDVPATGPCATDHTTPVINTSLAVEVPVGTTQVTITGGVLDDSPIASVTVGGQSATLTDPGPSFSATVPVAGPDPVTLSVIATDECDNGTIAVVTVTFVEICAPELDVCMDNNAGTVFWIDLIDPSGTTCQLQCSTDALGQGLACASTPVCPQ